MADPIVVYTYCTDNTQEYRGTMIALNALRATDERNASWAETEEYPPQMTMSMRLKNELAVPMAMGKHYMVTIEELDEEPSPLD